MTPAASQSGGTPERGPAAIKTAIVAILTAIPGIGRVLDRPRLTRDGLALAEHYTVPQGGPDDGPLLLGWSVSRTRATTIAPHVARRVIDQTWSIEGWRAFDDDADSLGHLETLIEAIRRAIQADETLGGAVATTLTPATAGIQLDGLSLVWLQGRALVHRAQLSLVTRHYE